MKSLQRALSATFKSTAPRAADKHRKAREEAKRLAALCQCEIESCKPGWNVWPPKSCAEMEDPFQDDHYAMDWDEVLRMVTHWAKVCGVLTSK